jgi:hypothetical protein
VHDAEGLGVALGPLEVVQQRPHDVGPQVGSGLAGPLGRREVVAQVGDAVLVAHGALDDVGVRTGRTVLHHQHRQAGALGGGADQLVETAGVDLPADVGDRLAHDQLEGRRARVGAALGVVGPAGAGQVRTDGRVVVETDPVGRALDTLEVAGSDELVVGELRRHAQQPGVVRAVDQGVEPDPVADGVDAVGDVPHLWTLRLLGPDGREVEHDAHVDRVSAGAQPLGGQRVAEHQVVGGAVRASALPAPGGVHAGGVPEVGRAPRLVVGGPEADAVAEAPVDDLGVVGEGLGGAALEPAALVLEGLGEVPVVERAGGLHAALEQGVDEPVVVVQAPLLHAPAALGDDARPGDREAVPVKTGAGDEVGVLGVAVVGVARDRAVRAVPDRAGARGEGVPDRGAAAVLGARALHLVRRRGGAQLEALGPGQPGRQCGRRDGARRGAHEGSLERLVYRSSRGVGRGVREERR